MHNRILCIITIIFSFSQCSNKEEKIEYYDNGAIKSKSEMVDGHNHGKAYTYYRNGVIYSIHNFDSGYVYGKSTFYDTSGRVSKRITYVKSVKQGPYEIYYPNGNIHEAGNFIADFTRGKVFQYYESDSGRLMREQYILDTKDQSFTYYIKRYDLNGNMISIDQPFEVILPNDTLLIGENTLIKFKFNNQNYDSAIVVLGDFDNPNYSYKKKDTVEFIGKEASTNFIPSKPGSQLLKGQYILYRKEQDADSVYEYTTRGLFEESITVIKNAPRYQAGL